MKRAIDPILAAMVVMTHHAYADGAASAPPPTAEQMRVHLARRPEMDEIRWKDEKRGGALAVRILEVTEEGVSVQKSMPAGVVSRVIPRSQLFGVSFSLTDVERMLHRHPSAAAVAPLRVLWKARASSLGMDGSNVTETGLALAQSLRVEGAHSSLEEAQRILDRILLEEKDENRATSVRVEVQTLAMAKALASGKLSEIDRLAWEITGTDDNPHAMLMAVAWLADRHFADLRKCEEEHPRWQEDDEVRPLRQRLYHLSLDFALYPSLFLGAYPEEAAAGLQKAKTVYQFTRSPQLAIRALEDLARLYPGTKAARETAEELARLKAHDAVRANDATSSAPREESNEKSATEENDAAVPEVPLPPKRYNLFDD